MPGISPASMDLLLNAIRSRAAQMERRNDTQAAGISQMGSSLARGIERSQNFAREDRQAEQARADALAAEIRQREYADKVRAEQERARVAAEETQFARQNMLRASDRAAAEMDNRAQMAGLGALTAPSIDVQGAMRQPTFPRGIPGIGGLPLAGVGAGLAPQAPTEGEMLRRIPGLPRQVTPDTVSAALRMARPQARPTDPAEALKLQLLLAQVRKAQAPDKTVEEEAARARAMAQAEAEGKAAGTPSEPKETDEARMARLRNEARVVEEGRAAGRPAKAAPYLTDAERFTINELQKRRDTTFDRKEQAALTGQIETILKTANARQGASAPAAQSADHSSMSEEDIMRELLGK